MTLVYRTAGAWGPGVGRQLVSAEVDTNFWTHDQAITALEALPLGVGISTITQTAANQMTITLTNGATYVFTLPALQLNFRGEWAPATYYSPYDVVTVATSQSVYTVLLGHLSASTFNPNANDGAGHNFYSLLLQVPNSLPAGGTTGMVLAKNSPADYDTLWQASGLPTGGTAAQALFKNSATNYDVLWRAPGFADLSGSPTPAQLRAPTNSILTPDVTNTATLNPVLGNIFNLTPAANTTINAGSAPVDARVVIFIVASATSYVITFASLFKPAGTLTTGTAPGTWIVSFACDGSFFYELSRSGPF